MKKVLYLPGLNSRLYQDRRDVLQSFDLEVFAPHCDYENNPNLLQELLDGYDVDMVVGSSAGGLGGYYFSGIKGIPALLFNPALPFRHYFNPIPTYPGRHKFLQIVIGAQDTVVPCMESFDFLRNEYDRNVPLEIHWINQMEHQLPIHIFRKELKYFLEQI